VRRVDEVYLDEFAFRFNRRRTPMAVFQTLLGLASGVHGPTSYDCTLHDSLQKLPLRTLLSVLARPSPNGKAVGRRKSSARCDGRAASIILDTGNPTGLWAPVALTATTAGASVDSARASAR